MGEPQQPTVASVGRRSLHAVVREGVFATPAQRAAAKHDEHVARRQWFNFDALPQLREVTRSRATFCAARPDGAPPGQQ